MKSLFMQTAEYRVEHTICLNELPNTIRKHTDWDYSCEQTKSGYFFKPIFRNMPYRNSFAPEIDVVVSGDDTQPVLHMQGRLVRFIRIFMAIWFSVLLIMELFFLAHTIISDFHNLFIIFIPIILCGFGYFLAK